MDEANSNNNLDKPTSSPSIDIRTVENSSTSVTTEELNKTPDSNTDPALLSLASLSLHSVSSSESTCSSYMYFYNMKKKFFKIKTDVESSTNERYIGTSGVQNLLLKAISNIDDIKEKYEKMNEKLRNHVHDKSISKPKSKPRSKPILKLRLILKPDSTSMEIKKHKNKKPKRKLDKSALKICICCGQTFDTQNRNTPSGKSCNACGLFWSKCKKKLTKEMAKIFWRWRIANNKQKERDISHIIAYKEAYIESELSVDKDKI